MKRFGTEMAYSKDYILAQIDDVLAGAQAKDGNQPTNDQYNAWGDTFVAQQASRMIAVVDRLTPEGSAYRRNVRAPYEPPAAGGRGVSPDNGWGLVQAVGVVQALRDDVAAGFTRSFEELIHADVFADFLEMADELQGKGYKDPAAVLAGSVLEEHLRKLAVRSGVATTDASGKPIKADRLNADLARVPVYGKLEQKSVTAWLDLRNKAAHGEYTEYDHAQVAALIQGVRDFMIRNPA
jgi:hypothetical protein